MSDDLFNIPQDADPLLRRAAIFVSVGDFANADVYCEKVLDAAPENAAAYLIKAMAKCQIRNAEQLVNVPGLTELTEFKLARQFADPALAAKLDELIRERERITTVVRPLREACTARIQALQELSAKPLSSDLAAEVKTRIEAEQALMRDPSVEAAEREAGATAELEDRIEKTLTIRKACIARIQALQELSARPLSDDLAAEVKTRIEAEQALMRTPTPEAAGREADATAELEDRIEKILTIRKACAARLLELKELSEKPLSDDLAAEVRQRIEAEQELMRDPSVEAAEREAGATAALKTRIGADQKMLRAACALRQEVLRNLLEQDLYDDLAAKVRQRIEAEQALMRAPSVEAAEREADATAALKDKIVPVLRERLAARLPQLKEIMENPNVPKDDREKASQLHDKTRALLEDPGADLRTLDYESERCKVEFEGLSEYHNHSDIGLWIGVVVLILFAIFVFVFLV